MQLRLPLIPPSSLSLSGVKAGRESSRVPQIARTEGLDATKESWTSSGAKNLQTTEG